MKPMDKQEEEYSQLLFDIKYDKEQFKDPTTIGLLLYRLSKEREAGNQMLKQILEKLEQISTSLATVPAQPQTEAMLADIDKQILTYIQHSGKVDAEEIQAKFGYRGKNAASARLNALFQKKLLNKGRAGKKVLYWV